MRKTEDIKYLDEFMIYPQCEVLVDIENLHQIEWAWREVAGQIKYECPACFADKKDGHRDHCWLGNILKAVIERSRVGPGNCFDPSA